MLINNTVDNSQVVLILFIFTMDWIQNPISSMNLKQTFYGQFKLYNIFIFTIHFLTLKCLVAIHDVIFKITVIT